MSLTEQLKSLSDDAEFKHVGLPEQPLPELVQGFFTAALQQLSGETPVAPLRKNYYLSMQQDLEGGFWAKASPVLSQAHIISSREQPVLVIGGTACRCLLLIMIGAGFLS